MHHPQSLSCEDQEVGVINPPAVSSAWSNSGRTSSASSFPPAREPPARIQVASRSAASSVPSHPEFEPVRAKLMPNDFCNLSSGCSSRISAELLMSIEIAVLVDDRDQVSEYVCLIAMRSDSIRVIACATSSFSRESRTFPGLGDEFCSTLDLRFFFRLSFRHRGLQSRIRAYVASTRSRYA